MLVKSANVESEFRIVSAMRSLFVVRDDCYCMQLKHGYMKVDAPLTDAVLMDHLMGEITVGSYQLSTEGFVKWLCFDVDPERVTDSRMVAQKLFDVMFEERAEPDGVKRPRIWPKAVLLESSRYPDSSYHIWVLFSLQVPAKVSRWLGLRILELANLNPKQVEVFPKQCELTADRPYGNFVKLPLGLHRSEGKWSCFLDFETFKPLPNEVLLDRWGISFTEDDLERIASFEDKKHVQATLPLPVSFKPLKSKAEQRIARFLVKYWRKGYRNKLEMAFLGFCIKRGVSCKSVKRIVELVCDLTGDEEKAARIQLVDYHYQKRRGSGNRLLGISGIREIVKGAYS